MLQQPPFKATRAKTLWGCRKIFFLPHEDKLENLREFNVLKNRL